MDRIDHIFEVGLWHGLVFLYPVGSASYRMLNLSVVQTAISSNYQASGRDLI